MDDWCDKYDKCKYFLVEYIEFDIFGHDTFNTFCTHNNKKSIIPRIHCKKCIENNKDYKENI